MPERLGRLRDRLAVLVGAREEEDVLAALAHVPREHVGGDRRVRVAEVRLAVHVVDRGGDVVRHPTIDSTRGDAHRARREPADGRVAASPRQPEHGRGQEQAAQRERPAEIDAGPPLRKMRAPARGSARRPSGKRSPRAAASDL